MGICCERGQSKKKSRMLPQSVKPMQQRDHSSPRYAACIYVDERASLFLSAVYLGGKSIREPEGADVSPICAVCNNDRSAVHSPRADEKFPWKLLSDWDGRSMHVCIYGFLTQGGFLMNWNIYENCWIHVVHPAVMLKYIDDDNSGWS